jgi:hypothetical protein
VCDRNICHCQSAISDYRGKKNSVAVTLHHRMPRKVIVVGLERLNIRVAVSCAPSANSGNTAMSVECKYNTKEAV